MSGSDHVVRERLNIVEFRLIMGNLSVEHALLNGQKLQVINRGNAISTVRFFDRSLCQGESIVRSVNDCIGCFKFMNG